MKALDLLKALRDDYIHGELSSDINEAIAELEALQERIIKFESDNKDMAHLYNELNTIKWWSAEKGDAWDGCVDAVCDFIKKEYLPKDSK